MNLRKYSISGIEFLVELPRDSDPEFIYRGTLVRVGVLLIQQPISSGLQLRLPGTWS